MPPYDPRAFIKLMFWSISFLLICTYLFGNENGDLSGEIYPTNNVKVIEVLEKDRTSGERRRQGLLE